MISYLSMSYCIVIIYCNGRFMGKVHDNVRDWLVQHGNVRVCARTA